MKLIIRANDVGYTVAHNMGTQKTLDEGITTHCDLMLDCPGFEDACAVKELSLDQHRLACSLLGTPGSAPF